MLATIAPAEEDSDEDVFLGRKDDFAVQVTVVKGENGLEEIDVHLDPSWSTRKLYSSQLRFMDKKLEAYKQEVRSLKLSLFPRFKMLDRKNKEGSPWYPNILRAIRSCRSLELEMSSFQYAVYSEEYDLANYNLLARILTVDKGRPLHTFILSEMTMNARHFVQAVLKLDRDAVFPELTTLELSHSLLHSSVLVDDYSVFEVMQKAFPNLQKLVLNGKLFEGWGDLCPGLIFQPSTFGRPNPWRTTLRSLEITGRHFSYDDPYRRRVTPQEHDERLLQNNLTELILDPSSFGASCYMHPAEWILALDHQLHRAEFISPSIYTIDKLKSLKTPLTVSFTRTPFPIGLETLMSLGIRIKTSRKCGTLESEREYGRTLHNFLMLVFQRWKDLCKVRLPYEIFRKLKEYIFIR